MGVLRVPVARTRSELRSPHKRCCADHIVLASNSCHTTTWCASNYGGSVVKSDSEGSAVSSGSTWAGTLVEMSADLFVSTSKAYLSIRNVCVHVAFARLPTIQGTLKK